LGLREVGEGGGVSLPLVEVSSIPLKCFIVGDYYGFASGLWLEGQRRYVKEEPKRVKDGLNRN